MKNVYVAQNPAEAHLVAGFLEEEGILAVVEGEMLFGARGEIGAGPDSLPHVSVADADAERALAVIASRKPAAGAVTTALDETEDLPRDDAPAE